MNWSKTMRDALIGVGQQPAEPAEPAADPVTQLLTAAAPSDRARQILLAAGLQQLYEDSGRIPLVLPADRPWQPADVDKRPLCSDEAAALLGQILSGHFRDMLHDLLHRLDRAGQRLPDHLLPNTLAYAGRTHRYQTDVIKIIGPRGRWLAGHHKKWEYATLDVHDWEGLLRRWQTGKLTDRARLLGQVRHFNPETGRNLLNTAWKDEPPNSRLYFVRQLEADLSEADEPFLERALDDRHQPVRRHAGRLLAQLPASRYAHRMGEYLTQIMRWRPSSTGERGRLSVAFPKAPSAGMRRDGIQLLEKQKPSFYVKHQLNVIVSAAPLDVWTDHWQVTPDEVVDAVAASGWPKTLFNALANAARQQQAAAGWVLPLIHATGFGRPALKLIPLLPEPEREETLALIIDQFGEEPLKQNGPLKSLWRDWPFPWSPQVARSMAQIFARHIVEQQNASAVDLSVRALWMRFMRQAPVAEAEAIEAALEPAIQAAALWRNELTDGLALLRFRQRLEEAFHQ